MKTKPSNVQHINAMELIEVTTSQQRQAFLDMVDEIYDHDSQYIRPLDKMINDIFDPQQNPLFKNGLAIRYIINHQNKTVGRIAAFINYNKAYGYQQPTGGIGFFECIDNQDVANTLFTGAVNWLRHNGMQAMDGPINFGENDNFWGLLVDGFTKPSFGMPYNQPYYQQLFEAYGFKPYYDQITNRLDLTKTFPERFWKIAERVVQKPELSFRHFEWKHREQFINDFIEVYNEAWQFHENFVPMQPSQLQTVINKSKTFIVEQLIWFAYSDNKPIAFIVMFPDVNQLISSFNGKLTTFNKLVLGWRIFRQKYSRTRVTVLGVKPAFQRTGVESGLFYQLKGIIGKFPHINEMELSWVGDFNPKMRALQEALGSEFSKRHVTYRYLFDDSATTNLTHSPTIPVDTKNRLKDK